ncbi:Cytochrome P450 [Popillia japonica]|uniref:Cytochrome P450 n=1 Tax=Popillia japonica TaxID=7064 RepID=A0AAW1KMJ8_POPJA
MCSYTYISNKTTTAYSDLILDLLHCFAYSIIYLNGGIFLHSSARVYTYVYWTWLKRMSSYQHLFFLIALLATSVSSQSNYANQANNIEYIGDGLPEQATLDGKVTQLDDLSPVIFLNRTKAALNCASGSMQVELKFNDNFYGIAYADFDRNSACKVAGKGALNYKLELPLKGCGTRQDPLRVFTNNIVVRFHPGLEMDGDEIITIVCRYPPPIAPSPDPLPGLPQLKLIFNQCCFTIALTMLLGILLVILSPLICWVIYWYNKVHYFEKYLHKIPGPKRLPLVGNALDLASSTRLLPVLMEYYKKYRTNFKMYIGAQPYLLLTEPKDLELVMSSTTILAKSDLYDLIHRWLGFGLLTSRGNRWRKHRKIITPAFHFQILEEFINVFNSQSDVLVDKLKEESKKGTIDIYPFIARCTLDIICETAMGTSVNAQADYNSEYVKCVNILLEIFMLRSFSPILSNNYLYPFTSTYRRENYALKVVHDYTRSVIASRKKEFLSDAHKNAESTDSPAERRNS